MKIVSPQFLSLVGPYLVEFINQKRLCGFSYNCEALILKQFDDYCLKNNLTVDNLTKKTLSAWCEIRPGLSKRSHSRYIQTLSVFLNYLDGQGYAVNIPEPVHYHKTLVHMLSTEKILDILAEADSYAKVKTKQPCLFRERMAKEYAVILRLIYCCGLRAGEACKLTWDNVSLERQALKIIHSKGDKDRIVYMHPDVNAMLTSYRIHMESRYNYYGKYVFPSSDKNKPMPVGTLDYVFNRFWSKTPHAATCDRKPTPHCLRHAFVIKRMTLWAEQGVNFNQMMAYLAKYLGHSSPEETLYYYHQTAEVLRVIRQLDVTSAKVIPEVGDD